MTTRDTYDIEQYEKELQLEQHNKKTLSTNIQPALLVKLMQDSEPCLFANKSNPVVNPVEKSINVQFLFSYYQMIQIARWHADLQMQFWDELFSDEQKGVSNG
jgi:hypothetical protein